MKTKLVLLLGVLLMFIVGCDPSSESTGIVTPTEQIPGTIDGEFTLAPGRVGADDRNLLRVAMISGVTGLGSPVGDQRSHCRRFVIVEQQSAVGILPVVC